MRFGKDGIEEPAAVVLAPFQVHRMRCEGGQVFLAGWDDDGYIEYAVGIAGTPRIVHHVREPGREFSPLEGRVDNLVFGRFGDEQIVPLESNDREHTYQLVLSDAMDGGDGGIEHHYRAKIRQVDRSGRLVHCVLLLDREEFEPVH